MKPLPGIALHEFPLSNLTKVSDLIYFDGPLLSHFTNKKGDDYLYQWVDRDEKYNRWIIFRVSLDELNNFIDGRITQLDLVHNPKDGFLYCVDMDDDTKVVYSSLAFVEELPGDYLPGYNSFYKFKPVNADDTQLASDDPRGFMAAVFADSRKVRYGSIHLDIYSHAMVSLNELYASLGQTYVKQKLNGRGVKKYAMESAGRYEVTGVGSSSFITFLRPIDRQLTLQGLESLNDKISEYIIAFLESSFSYESLISFSGSLNNKAVKSYEAFLNVIRENDIDFKISWTNSLKTIRKEQVIRHSDTYQILENLNKLEYENQNNYVVIGKFTAINLRTGSYSFEVEEGDILSSTGHFSPLLKEMALRFAFDRKYKAEITRVEKKTGTKKTAEKDDLMISAYDVTI